MIIMIIIIIIIIIISSSSSSSSSIDGDGLRPGCAERRRRRVHGLGTFI